MEVRFLHWNLVWSVSANLITVILCVKCYHQLIPTFSLFICLVSQLMYSYTDLRKWVDLHELTFQDKSISEKEIEDNTIVSFKHVELVDTRLSPTNEYKETKLRAPVQTKGILKFLEENQKWFSQPEGEDITFDENGENTEPIFMMEKLKDLAKFDSDIVEYDDEGNPNSKLKLSGTELVYAIIINR